MAKNVFGNNTYKNGSKIVSNEEWNQMNDSVTSVNYGDSGFGGAYANERGLHIPADAHYLPHTAEISADYNHAVIGVDREEVFYPFIDYVQVNSPFILARIDATNDRLAPTSTDYTTKGYNVIFPTMDEIVPAEPTSADVGVIVGYEWNMFPHVTALVVDGNNGNMGITWQPFPDFDLGQNLETTNPSLSYFGECGLYTEEYLSGTINSWSITNSEGLSTFNLKDMMNEYIDRHPEELSAYIVPDELEDAIYTNKIIKLPIARYDWNEDATDLTRCVQLYFGNAVGGSAAGAPLSGGPEADPLIHPFRCTAVGVPQYYYVVGLGRGESWYQPADLITVYDIDKSIGHVIEKTEAEYIQVSGADQIIYYRIYREETGASPWKADLAAATVLNFSILAEQDTEAMFVPIAKSLAGGSIAQLQFSDISIWPRGYRPSFSAFTYEGGVVLSDGKVNISVNDTTSVAGVKVENADEAWVEIDIEPDTTPVVNPIVQVGNYPGYESYASGRLFRYILLGKRGTNGEWIPTHTGDINLGTMYQPEIAPDGQFEDAQGYRMLAGSATSTGATKDLFFDGVAQGIDVVGGDFEKITNIADVKLGGVTNNVAQSLVTGGSKDGNTLTLSTASWQHQVDKGLTQVNEVTNTADIVIELDDATAPVQDIQEGAGIDVSEGLSGIFTITSLLDDDGDGVVVTDGGAGAAHIVSLDYPAIWGHTSEGPGIDLTVAGDDLTVESLLEDDGTGVDVTQGGAGAAHIVSIDYPTIWGHVKADPGIGINIAGDDVEIESLLDDDNTGVKITQGAAGAAHIASIDYPIIWQRLIGGEGIDVNVAGDNATISTIDGVLSGINSVQIVDKEVQLVNDEDVPPDFTCYAQGLSGAGKGWLTVEELCDNSDSIATNTPDGGQGTKFDVIVTTDSSIEILAEGVELINDEEIPTDFSCYGKGVGNKGWNTIEELCDNSDSIATNTPAGGQGTKFDLIVTTDSSIDVLSSGVELLNDEETPGNNKFYGTSGSGTKGWEGFVQVTLVTDVQLTSGGVLEKKTRTAWVTNPSTESAWVSAGALSTTTCPSGA